MNQAAPVAISGPTVLGRSSDEDIRKLLEAHGYEVHQLTLIHHQRNEAGGDD